MAKTPKDYSKASRERKKLAEEEKKEKRRERDRNRKREKRALDRQQRQEDQEAMMNSPAARQGFGTPNRHELEEQHLYETPPFRPQPRQPFTMPALRTHQHHPVLDLFRDQNQIVATVFGAAPVAGSQRDGGAPYSEGRPRFRDGGVPYSDGGRGFDNGGVPRSEDRRHAGLEAQANGGWNRRIDSRHDHQTDGIWHPRNDGRHYRTDGSWNRSSSGLGFDDGDLRDPPSVHRFNFDDDDTEGSASRWGLPPHPQFIHTTPGSMYRVNHWGATAQSGSSLEARDHGWLPAPPPRHESENSSLSSSTIATYRSSHPWPYSMHIDTAVSPVARRNPQADENSPPVYVPSPPFGPSRPMFESKSSPNAKLSAKKNSDNWTCKHCDSKNDNCDANCADCTATRPSVARVARAAPNVETQDDDEDEGPSSPVKSHYKFH